MPAASSREKQLCRIVDIEPPRCILAAVLLLHKTCNNNHHDHDFFFFSLDAGIEHKHRYFLRDMNCILTDSNEYYR